MSSSLFVWFVGAVVIVGKMFVEKTSLGFVATKLFVTVADVLFKFLTVAPVFSFGKLVSELVTKEEVFGADVTIVGIAAVVKYANEGTIDGIVLYSLAETLFMAVIVVETFVACSKTDSVVWLLVADGTVLSTVVSKSVVVLFSLPRRNILFTKQIQKGKSK